MKNDANPQAATLVSGTFMDTAWVSGLVAITIFNFFSFLSFGDPYLLPAAVLPAFLLYEEFKEGPSEYSLLTYTGTFLEKLVLAALAAALVLSALSGALSIANTILN